MGKTKTAVKPVLGKVLTGALAGFLNGLFGGGGGMIVVPCLTFILAYEEKKAHATAILIILPLSVLSGILYFTLGSVDYTVAANVTAGVTLGGIIGALFLKKLNGKVVAVIFSALMAAAGVKMLFF